MQLMTDNSTKTLINLTKQIYNGLTQAIEDGDTKEAAERLKQDDVISAQVKTETDARIQADSDEASARQTKDAELQTAIETEVTERKGADTSLQSNIDKEATTRASADTAINTKLDEIKKLSDLFYLDTPTGANGESDYNGQFINYFGRIKYKDIDINGEALPLASIDDQDWVKRAVRILNKRMINKQNNRGVAYCMGWFTPGTTWCILGACTANTSSTNSEGDPSYSNFIAFSYGAQSVRLFGTNNYVWSFGTLPLTSTVNNLINNAKTALETAYKNADTQLQTDITKAYQQADTNLSTTLTQAYTDADTALKTELEGKINAGQIVTTTGITTSNIIRSTAFAFSSSEKKQQGLVSGIDFSISYATFSNDAYIENNMYLKLQRDSETTSSSFVGRFSYIGNTPVYFAASNFNLVDTNNNISVFHPIFEVYNYSEVTDSYGYTTITFDLIYNRQFKVWSENTYTYETPVIACRTGERLQITKKVSLNKLAFNV